MGSHLVSSPKGMSQAPPSTCRTMSHQPGAAQIEPARSQWSWAGFASSFLSLPFLSHPFLSLPVFLPSRFPSLPAPFPHVLTAEADADDEDDEGDDGGYQGDDDDLALVPSQVEQIHPLAASAGVASLAPAPQHRGGRGGSQKLPWCPCPLILLSRGGRAQHPTPCRRVPTGGDLHTSRCLLGHEEAAPPFDTVVLVLLRAPGEVALPPQLRPVPWG